MALAAEAHLAEGQNRWFENFMDLRVAEIDGAEKVLSDPLGIETSCVQIGLLWLMTYLFIFRIYLTAPSVARTMQIGLLRLLVNNELDRTGRKSSFPNFIIILSFTRRD
jgi:hypothetical protein